ncbi:hypothetical protein [Sessilibacter sp. MAH2]
MLRKALKMIVVLIGLTGIMFVCTSFISSWTSLLKAKSERASYDISDLGVGQYVMHDFTRESPWERKVLIPKVSESELKVYSLPIRDNKFILPKYWFWWGWHLCNKLGPESNDGLHLKDGAVIRCLDENASEGYGQWQRSIDGKFSKSWVPDIIKFKYEIVQGCLYINA